MNRQRGETRCWCCGRTVHDHVIIAHIGRANRGDAQAAVGFAGQHIRSEIPLVIQRRAGRRTDTESWRSFPRYLFGWRAG